MNIPRQIYESSCGKESENKGNNGEESEPNGFSPSWFGIRVPHEAPDKCPNCRDE